MLEEKIMNLFHNATFFCCFSFVSWFVVTTIWAIKKDTTKKGVIERYIFTFIVNLIYLIVYYVFFLIFGGYYEKESLLRYL
jgi:hypothetical protein